MYARVRAERRATSERAELGDGQGLPLPVRGREGAEVPQALVVRQALQRLAVDALRRPPERPVGADDLRAEENRRDDVVRLEASASRALPGCPSSSVTASTPGGISLQSSLSSASTSRS
jgi:hypothetical protein